MTLPAKLILFLCFIGCFPLGQAINVSADLRVVYVGDGHTLYPFAIFNNGESVIDYTSSRIERDRILWDAKITAAFEPFENRLKNDTFYGYTIHPDNKRTHLSFDELYPQKEQAWSEDKDIRSSSLPAVVINDPSPDFMADARYTAYTLAEQDKVPKVYYDYIRRRLHTDGLYNTPILIKEVWEFDFDGDGKDEAFIVANNAPDEPMQEKAAAPETITTEDGVGFYSYKLFYSETFLPIDIEILTVPLRAVFEKEDTKIRNVFDPLYEYDKDGHIRLFDTWWINEFGFDDTIDPPAPFNVIICDLNGDGLYDFLYLNYTKVYAPYIFYLQSSDGDFIRTGGMYKRA